MRARSLGFSALLLTALSAACAPSTFDGLTGGTKDDGKGPLGVPRSVDREDPDLAKKDPRPVSPFAASWVNTDRPRFTWKLQEKTIGAIVEISKNRKFEPVEQKIIATGTEGTVADPLAPGLYFWRLKARGDETHSPTYGPTWEVLVRGKPPNASKDNSAAHGGFSDTDGDGTPDLQVVFDATVPGPTPGVRVHLPTVATLAGVGGANQPISFDPFQPQSFFPFDCATPAPALAAGFDLDGDGYGEVIIADIWAKDTFSADWLIPGGGGFMYSVWGGPIFGPDGLSPDGETGELEEEPEGDDDDFEEEMDSDYPFIPIITQPFSTIPAISVGDFNGDGFGDVSAIFKDIATTIQGNNSSGWFELQPFEAPTANAPASFVVGSGDFNGDGISDLAYTPFDNFPLRLTSGTNTRFKPSPNLSVGGTDDGANLAKIPTRASAIATGDFDGDGFDEVAFATTLDDGSPAFCVHTIVTPQLNAHACWKSDAAITSLAAGDATGDGIDEIFVGTANSIRIVSHAGIGYADATSTFKQELELKDPKYTNKFTVFWPGGPGVIGKAGWALYGTDGKTVFIFDGLNPAAKQSFDLTKLSSVSGFAALEFVKLGTSIR
jgi:hypothetical protein